VIALQHRISISLILDHEILDGPLRLQGPIAPETHLGQSEPEAVRPEQSGSQGTARLGLAHEP
jgi:hypothetical protein